MKTATTTRYTQSQVTFVETTVTASDIKIVDHEGKRRCVQLGSVYAYLDTDGVTALLKQLLEQPEAHERPELAMLLTTAAAAHTDCIRQAV